MEDRYLFKAKTAQIVGIYNNGLEDGVWVHGSLRCDVGKYTIFQFETERADYVEYEIDPSTICQCTGLKDKNGKLIWENDIVKGKYYDGGKAYEHMGQIKYYCQSYKVVGINQYEGYHAELNGLYEIVGNIFDNPELLESEG